MLCLVAGALAPRVAPAQDTTPDSAVAYLDSVAALVRRSHWDTTVVGARWEELQRALRDSLRATPTVAEARRRAAQLLGALGTSHFTVLPSSAAPGEPTGDGTLRLRLRVYWPYVLLMDVPPASTAWNAGLRAGQLLETIRGRPVAELLAPLGAMPPRLRDTHGPGIVLRALAGEVGSPIRVGVRELSGQYLERFVARERPAGEALEAMGLPPQPAEFEAWTLRHDGMRIGAIRFGVWLPQLAARIDSAVDRLRDADAIVLDLRGNPGGAALMATGVAGHFVDDTLVLATLRTRTGTLRYRTNPRRVSRDGRPVRPFAGPLVLLVDAGSASTTELFAGALQQARRAIVVGDTSAGMALPAQTSLLPFGDRLLHAIADLRLADGRSLEGAGVVPDVAVAIDRRRLALGQDPEFLVAAAVAASRARAAQLGRPAPAGAAPPARPTR